MKRIYLSEEQFNDFLNKLREDVRFSKNNDGTVNMNIGQSKLDKDNSGGIKVDTRVFGTRNDILNGDGSANRNTNSLSRSVMERKAAIYAYKELVDYISNGKRGNVNRIFSDKNTPAVTVSTIKKWLNGPKSDEEIKQDALRAISRIEAANAQNEILFNRANNSKDGENIERYAVITIPGTNVKCIALFKMGSFDISDAIKHGGIRATGKMASEMGLKQRNGGMIGVTYDGGITPQLDQNFSLNGLDDINKKDTVKDHFKNVQQYANGTEYSSVNQFLDKSIMYAAHTLKKENFIPNFIISVPSSSKMNRYYCINLSNKLGVPYIEDFFKRDIINARFSNNITEEDILKDGFTPLDIEDIKNEIKKYAYKEMIYEIEAPLRKFVDVYINHFSEIPMEKYSRSKLTKEQVLKILSKYAFKILKDYASSDRPIEKHLARNFCNQAVYEKDEKSIVNSIIAKIKTKIGIKVFDQVLFEMLGILKKYANQVLSNGYKIHYGSEGGKITKMRKDYRKYIDGSFIIADKNFNKNGELFTRIARGKLLIVDEDINSGGSFALCIKALQEKMPEVNSNNVECLANGYSENGQ